MTAAPLCVQCHSPLPAELINTGAFGKCLACGSELAAEVFPAFFRPPEKGSFGESLLIDTHSSCFYHAQKQASVICAGCGRFICSLCDVELEGEHVCPPCLETAHKSGKIKSMESRRILHDTIAFHLALLSVLIFYVSFITAPLALFWAIKHRNSPGSLLGPTRLRRVLAIIFASMLIIGWIALIAFLILRR